MLRVDSEGCLWSVIVGICINKYILLLSATMVVVSCDLAKFPEGSIFVGLGLNLGAVDILYVKTDETLVS